MTAPGLRPRAPGLHPRWPARRLDRVGLCGLALVAAAAAAPPAQARGDDPDATLSAKDVARAFEPHAPEVRSCYFAQVRPAGDATLRLELIIDPGGGVFRFGFAAPGVARPALDKLDGCLRPLAAAWQFPARKRYTTAVVPVRVQPATAPGASPTERCPDPGGCPPGAPRGGR